MKLPLLALLPFALMAAERDPQNHTFTTRDYIIHMQVRFHEGYSASV